MEEISLYIHIPFCKQKCLYCDFPSFSGKESLINSYVDSLIKEMQAKCSDYIIASLFIGGGTPSYLDKSNLKKLLNQINKLNFKQNAEKTIECNPGTLNEEKLEIIKNGGINRISFGLQSTDDKLLKEIGRIHNYNEFLENYKMARKIGFDNINIDLMYGLPNQTADSYLDSLREIIKLNPEHISAYSLIIEEGTKFYQLYQKDLLDIPTEDDERKMYNIGRKLLLENGYKHYEISNFARTGRECFHNKVYWKCKQYIGIGAFASSYMDSVRYKNTEGIEQYIYKINNNIDTKIIEKINTGNDDIEEFMFMGLRMIEGISEDEFIKRFNIDVFAVYKKVIEDNIKKGLLLRKNRRIYLTEKGIEFSNLVMSDMIL